jgi:uncharacterized membrane protein YphA (DoxX/SURF4 family)
LIVLARALALALALALAVCGQHHNRGQAYLRQEEGVMRSVPLVGRVLFAAIFILSSFANFSPASIQAAAQRGLPLPQLLVPMAGVMSLVGGLSVLFGYQARLGALLLILFLIPVTLMMHNFWTVRDPMMVQIQLINFFKNLSMLGGALFVYYFGAGPLSVDAWLAERERRPTPPVLTPTRAT